MSNNRELADLISQAGGTSEGVLAGRRNLIINGAMQVWQRGTSFSSPPNSTYTSDRWKVRYISGVTRSTDVPAGEGFQYSAKVDIATGSDNQFYQLIENGIGITDTKTVTLSFWAKTDEITTGFENIYILNDTNFELLSSSGIEITSSWARYTKTFTLNPTNNNYSDSLMIRFDASESVGGSYYITGVQLELGSVATPFEHRSYGEELALCQRYYWKGKLAGNGVAFLYAAGGSTDMFIGSAAFSTTMRAEPSITILTQPTYANCSNGESYAQSTDGVMFRADVTTTGRYRAYGAILGADAEL